jgi:hypothetical protein
MFAHQNPLLPWRRLNSKYRAEDIADFFRRQFIEDDGAPALLGSAKLKKLLLVVMRNATTGSPWPISSNPRALFNEPALANSNLKIPLWQLLRASTAAPTFFPPEEIAVGKETFLFVDGGVTPYNNPALLATLMATLPRYRLAWKASRDALHVVSIGTGGHRTRLGKQLPLFSGNEQKFTYARYNCMMDSKEVGDPLTPAEMQLDNLRAIERLRSIGREYAARTVRREHLFRDVSA